MFFGSFDYKFTRKVAKTLVNDGIHYSLGQSYVIIRSLSPARIVIFSQYCRISFDYLSSLIVIRKSKLKLREKSRKQKINEIGIQ